MDKAIPFPGGPPKGTGFLSRDVPISAVPRIARICALGLAFDELLDEVCREILALSGADGGCLFLSPRDESSETFSPEASRGRFPTSARHIVPARRSSACSTGCGRRGGSRRTIFPSSRRRIR